MQEMLQQGTEEFGDSLEKVVADCQAGGFLPPRGNTEAEIFFLASEPSYADIKSFTILSNETGIISQTLKAYELEDKVWFSSVLKKNSKGKKPSAKDIASQRVFVERELALIKPKLIVALGDVALKMLIGQVKYKDWTGMVLNSKYGKVIAVPNPYVVDVLDPMSSSMFKHYFHIGYEHVTDHVYDSWTYQTIKDPAEAREVLQAYLDAGYRRVSFDGEWLPAEWNKNEIITDFEISFDGKHALLFDITNATERKENTELLDTLKMVFEREDIELVGWNCKGDLKRLLHRGFKIPDKALKFDGMIATALINSRHGKGLDDGIFNYSNLPHYYVPLYEKLREHGIPRAEMVRMKEIDLPTWEYYISGDAISHWVVCDKMAKALEEFCPPKVVEYYYKTYLPLSWFLVDMEMTGLPIDTECMETMTKLYHTGYQFFYTKMLKLASEWGIEDYNPHYWSSANALLFDKLKLQPAFYTKKSKGKSRFWYKEQKEKTRSAYKASTNAKGLGIMLHDLLNACALRPDNEELKRKLEVLQTHIAVNKINPIANKFLSKENTKYDEDDEDDEEYVEIEGEVTEDEQKGKKTSYWNAIGLNDRIYPDIYPCLDNFRLSTKPNTQVAPAKVLPSINRLFREFEPELRKLLPGLSDYVPRNIRNVFHAGHPDWVVVETDAQSADLAHVAYIAKDDLFLRNIREKSFHVEMAKKYFADDNLTKEGSPEKVIQSKTMSFNSCYTSHFESAAWAIQALIYGETGKLFTNKELVGFLDKGWGQYEDYMRYKKHCEEFVKTNFYIENNYGMRLNFEPSDDYTSIARYVNRSLAWPVASSMALHMHDVAVGLRDYFKRQGEWLKWVYPVNSIHDCHILTAHKDLLKDDYLQAVIFAYFSKLTPIATGDYIGVEIVIGDCWKSKTPVWEGKSKWVNNTWELNGH